ncbi:class I lanthipeptide [Pedobacter jeongneungensis]|uniref:class I lanthipeptide n=1 Tax=Pedobacter jeongneungensis TaxID=947309 RepID=UPI0004694A07|nr:class I lanthipeptide [Pedobacter jeongneungensis]
MEKKKNSTDRKLSLKKKAISNLNDLALDQVQGGNTFCLCTKVGDAHILKEPETTVIHFSCGS